ncbi:MAG: molybdopterin biosynthesis protein MoeA, partial [Synergistaceae bacterium]
MAVKYPEHISLEEAQSILLSAFAQSEKQNICALKISRSLGLVLARDITAGRNVPHYAASAVDGYALDASDTIGATPATPRRAASEK